MSLKAAGPRTLWFFDLDNTLHDAGRWVFPRMNAAMTHYIRDHLAMAEPLADELRVRYWRRYGSTLLGLIRHHGVQPSHFLHETHRFPDLEQQVRGHRADLECLRRLPGRRILLTNAPRAYALRVLQALRIADCFEAVLSIEDMVMFGHWRPKPDARMFRYLAARLGARPQDCVLVEDTLEHQKSARSVGWRTVWMQRWLRSSPPATARLHRCPAYVDRRIRSLAGLCKNHPKPSSQHLPLRPAP